MSAVVKSTTEMTIPPAPQATEEVNTVHSEVGLVSSVAQPTEQSRT